jgi:hyperosmotically inducible periplasmic protein
MKMKCTLPFSLMTVAALALLLGCSERSTSADVKGNIEQALNQAGLKSVNVSQDRDKGVITLTGDVLTEADKQRAEEIAKSMAHSSVVANEIGVRPSGLESEAKKVDASLDAAIEKNLEAVLVGRKLDHDIKYSAKNGVVTLSGDVNSIERRNELEQLAASVPNVKQVINELQVKEMKATSRK